MARARLISACLGSSRKFRKLVRLNRELSEFAAALFPLLVVNADDWGLLEGDGETIKFKVFSISDRPEEDFDAALQLLHEVNLITLYEVKGERFLQIVQFNEHQHLSRPSMPRYPLPSGFDKKQLAKCKKRKVMPGNTGNDRETQGITGNPQEKHGMPGDDKTSPVITGKRRRKQKNPLEENRTEHELNRTEEESPSGDMSAAPTADGAVTDDAEPEEKPPETPKVTVASQVREVFDYWRVAMGHPGALLAPGGKRDSAIRGRLKQGYTVDQIKRGVDGCRASPHNQGRNDHGVTYDDIELICRNEANLERFIGIAERGLVANGNRPETASERNARLRLESESLANAS